MSVLKKKTASGWQVEASAFPTQIRANVNEGFPEVISAGDTPYLISTNRVKRVNTSSYTDTGLSITIPTSGKYRFKFGAQALSGYQGYVQVYLNNSPYGEELTTGTSGEAQSFDIDIVCSENDTVRLFAKTDASLNAVTVSSLTACISWNVSNGNVFNQLVQNGNFANGTTNWNKVNTQDSMSAEDGILTVNRNVGTGNLGTQVYPTFGEVDTTHKYLIKCFAKCDDNTYLGLGFHTSGGTTGSNNIIYFRQTDEFIEKGVIASPVNTTDRPTLRVGDTSIGSGKTMYIKNFMVVDLTVMYGAGNEPSTVEEIKEILPNDYYDYDIGTT